MRIFFFVALFSISLFAGVKDSIVKIYTTAKVPSYNTPWNTTMKRAHGSGAIISENRILTNAHVVANETFIEVKRYGETKRYAAKVAFIAHQVDLAILEVEDVSFFDGSVALEVGKLPSVQEHINVYGFPMGGNALSVTSGVVSRIEHTRYAHSGETFLAIQIDAAINPGNSGGPAISDAGKIVGVVMQQIKGSQNIGYLVPSEVVEHFLKDVEDGVCDGFANLGISTQKMENDSLRKLYKMKENQSGVLVLDISENSSLFGKLQKGDILLSIDGHTIHNDATVEFTPEQFTSFIYYVDKKQLRESVEFTLLRKGREHSLTMKLQTTADKDLLVKTLEHDVMPRYYILGGYVFTPLTRNLLMTYRSTPLHLQLLSAKWATKERDEAVVLLKVLPDTLNRGDHSYALWMVESLNDKPFKNFAEFVKLLKSVKEPYVRLKNEDGVEIVIDVNEANKRDSAILRRYSITKSEQL